MNRPKYKNLYLKEKNEKIFYKNLFDHLLVLLGQLGGIKVNDREFELENSFARGRAIEICNELTGKTRWISFKLEDGDKNE